MNKIKIFVAFVAGMATVSCSVDNYPGPDAQIHGKIYDIETGALVEQDVDNGVTIRYIEHGYVNPAEQSMIFKTNGEYRNNLMFSGIYDFYFYETNFTFPQELISDYPINEGDNILDFGVIPYVRFSNVSMKLEERSSGESLRRFIIADFDITPTVEANVTNVALFGHLDYVVGDRYKNTSTVQQVGEAFNGQTKHYTLELDVTDYSTRAGTLYWFRVGAIVDMPNAKYNYAPAQRLEIL